MTPSEQKRLIDIFLRTHERRQSFLYTGFHDTYYSLGSENEESFKYGLPEQSVCLIEIKDKEVNQQLKNLLLTFKINLQEHLIVNLKVLFSYITKLKFDFSNLSVEKDREGLYYMLNEKKVYYALSINSHFTTLRIEFVLKDLFERYKSKNFDQVSIEAELLKQNKFKFTLNRKKAQRLKRERTFFLSRGKDIPTYKDCTVHIRVTERNKTFRMSGYLEDKDVNVFILRPNMIFI